VAGIDTPDALNKAMADMINCEAEQRRI
jgi:hypothetical protein